MSRYLLIKQGNIHNAVQEEAFAADILVENGKIKKIAPVLEGKIVNEAEVVDATGMNVYPGFVDAHCHLGLDGYATGTVGQDFNELSDPVTPQLSAVDAVNPQDETFRMAREGGVTCVCTGPGSANVIGGTFCVLKTRGTRVDDMIVKEKAAKHIGAEDRVGSIEEGKDADFVLTRDNPFAIDTRILYTIIDGEIVYRG